GRIDEQVKIRGFRIELGEIEALLQQFSGIQQAVVVISDQDQQNKLLVAYYTASTEAKIELDALKKHLAEHLPDYMIPAAFIALDEIPLTPNGKVDRRALSQREVELVSTCGYVAPRNDIERILCEVWQAVLGLESVGIYDHFFELGGHSLLALNLVNRIQTALPWAHLRVGTVLQHPTPAAFSQQLSYSHSPIVTLQAQGQQAPLWIAPAIIGFIEAYSEFAQALSTRPVYGLQLPGAQADETALPNIPALATHCLKLIQAQQPSGPYHLMGHSFGGLIAYEMALQLSAQPGVEFSLIIMDVFSDLQDKSRWQQGQQGELEKEEAEQEQAIKEIYDEIGLAMDDKLLQNMLKLYRHHRAMDYRPQVKLSQPVTLIKAAERGEQAEDAKHSQYSTDEAMGWSAYAEKLDI
ncbi:MAG: thioesterase domain-containing protein, partial [Pseudomonadales bacterium]